MDSTSSEPEWFVYSNEAYYPYAEIIAAKSAEEAKMEFIYRQRNDPKEIVVFPFSAVAIITEAVIEDLRDAGNGS